MQSARRSATSPLPLSKLLRRWTALMAGVLIAATWPLWTLQSEFPAIPAFGVLCELPRFVDWAALAGLLVGLAGIILGGERIANVGSLCVILAGLTLIGLDQHRFQPWMYQLLLFLLILHLPDKRFACELITWLVISIYFYSAIGKLDYEFLHTVGQQFLAGFLHLLRLERILPRPVPTEWIAALPLLELSIAVGLVSRQTRRWAGIAAITMHLSLILLLGPLGLKHSAGVVLWNMQFAMQALLLFVRPNWPNEDLATATQSTPRDFSLRGGHRSNESFARLDLLATIFVSPVILLPLVERLGYWDHWPSWALYAAHSSRAEVWIAGKAVGRLPVSLQREMDSSEESILWQRVPIERWSLAQTGTPIYPQARFQLGVGIALADMVASEFEVKILVRSVANRLTGARRTREFEGLTEIKQASRNFWLNTLPRFQDLD